MDPDTVHALRLRAQLLSGTPARRVEAVVAHLLAVQGQDARGARLAVRARSRGLTAADVDAALTDRRSLVISWLNRGTLHLVSAEDYWWLHSLTTPQLRVRSVRRLRQEGVSARHATKGVDVVAAAVEAGPQTRAQLRGALDRARVPTAGQALIHVLFAAALDGLLVRGPMVGTEHAFVSPTKWLGSPPPTLERGAALARLARRYLAGHGPATADDLARWAGIALGDARAGIDALGDEVLRLDEHLQLASSVMRTAPKLPGPRLLGSFEPVLLGWTSRDAVVGAHRELVTNNGLFRPFAMAGGRAIATWGLAGAIATIRPLEPIDDGVRAALADDATAVLTFLGLSPKPAVFV